LFEALKAENPDVTEADLLSGPDYREHQRQYMEDKKALKTFERLERRAGERVQRLTERRDLVSRYGPAELMCLGS
jgi:hypothetical protein